VGTGAREWICLGVRVDRGERWMSDDAPELLLTFRMRPAREG
jgi:hypothetical protein